MAIAQSNQTWVEGYGSGKIVAVMEAIHGPSRVVIKLDACSHTVTIPWSEPDDYSIVYPAEPEH